MSNHRNITVVGPFYTTEDIDPRVRVAYWKVMVEGTESRRYSSQAEAAGYAAGLEDGADGLYDHYARRAPTIVSNPNGTLPA